ncbi:amidohydrolase family protein [Catenuloplanes sp. NPDC051500]|uniref:amidohydrolase family protein n=1 Tax=Catenuloplanes sp. NPDC051500 TaxID=3363959 RepID=UPI003796BF96
MAIDTHVHFWDPAELDYSWLAGTSLERRYGPEELAHDAGEVPELIMVQADCAVGQARDEVEWVRALHPRVRGIVAYAPLETGDLSLVEDYAADPFVVGVRRNIQDESPGFAVSDQFRYGMHALGAAGLTFDACIRHHQIGELVTLARDCAGTTIVLDHLGKPPVATGEGRAAWRAGLAELAELPNVYCKLSGLVTEAPFDSWTVELIRPYLAEALSLFGPGRCLFGSDWPVVNLASDYRQWRGLVRRFVPEQHHEAVFDRNARAVYRLDSPRPGR